MKSLRSKGLKLSLVLVVSTTCCTGHVYPCVSMNHRHRVVRVVNGSIALDSFDECLSFGALGRAVCGLNWLKISRLERLRLHFQCQQKL